MAGPQICFEGKMCVTDAQRNLQEWGMTKKSHLIFFFFFNSIMSHVLNNVGPGLNIVVINSEQELQNWSTKAGKKLSLLKLFNKIHTCAN